MSATDRLHRIPLSPSSPPETGLKRRRLSEHAPKSPPTPPLMSVATKSYVSSYGNSQHTDEMAPRSSPRSPSHTSSYTQQSTQRTSQAYSTPASSMSGIPGLTMIEEADQHRDKRQKFESGKRDDIDSMEVDDLISRTDHDRLQKIKKESSPAPKPIASDSEDATTREKGKGRLASDETTLEQLQKDMGDAFLLCRSKVEQQRPNTQKHLLAMYGLSPLLRSVARNDPLTGEKINKLRKSYEGQIKSFGLAGRNSSVKGERNVDADEPGPLRRIAGSAVTGIMPDDQWQAEHGQTKIEVTPDFRARLQKAVQMQPGTVRNNAHWENVLGHDKARPGVVATPPPTLPVVPPRIPNGVVRPQALQTAEARRQTRGKKRSYGDDSFVGYGEGFSDPEDQFGGEGEYGEDEGAIRKKRKKDSMGLPITYGQMLNR